MANCGLLLQYMALASVLGLVHGQMVLSGCTNAYMRLQCPSDEKLVVQDVTVEKEQNPACGMANEVAPPPVPADMSHLCQSAYTCIYEEDLCVGTNDCAFYVGATFRDKKGRVRGNSLVRIKYSCAAGTSRKGAIAGFLVVALALVIVVVVILIMLMRRPGGLDDASKYVEFENRLSRTPSMTSEISAKVAVAKIKDKNEKADEASKAEEGNVTSQF